MSHPPQIVLPIHNWEPAEEPHKEEEVGPLVEHIYEVSISSLIVIWLIYVWEFYLHVCLCTLHVYLWRLEVGDWSLELELQTVVNWPMGAGNWTQSVWESIQCS